MTDEELINVCQAISHGNTRKVKNLENGKEGIAVSYEGKNLAVIVGKSTEHWSFHKCQEIYSG